MIRPAMLITIHGIRGALVLAIGDGQANQGPAICNQGSGRSRNRLYLGSKRARPTSKPFQKGGGRSLPPFWRGLEVDRARVDPKYKRLSVPAKTLVADGQNPGLPGRRFNVLHNAIAQQSIATGRGKDTFLPEVPSGRLASLSPVSGDRLVGFASRPPTCSGNS
jgi:hypothetical protein